MIFRIEATDAENVFHVTGGGLAEVGPSVIGVSAILGFCRLLLKGLDDFGEGHFIGLADAHVDQGEMGFLGAGGGLGSFDFLKFIDLVGFPVGGPADSFRKKILDIGFRHSQYWGHPESAFST